MAKYGVVKMRHSVWDEDKNGNYVHVWEIPDFVVAVELPTRDASAEDHFIARYALSSAKKRAAQSNG